MQNTYITKRLTLTELDVVDDVFITKLVNTPEWIQFIGDRNIKTKVDARLFIQKIRDNPKANYWVVKLPGQISIGIITFIKRDYLEHYDIGFAFLSGYAKKGYAYEATLTVLNDVIQDPHHKHILATTVKENKYSIKLLEKLGLRCVNELEHGIDLLWVYSASVDKLLINQVTRDFFDLFTNARQEKPALDKIHSLCLSETIVIKKNTDKEEIFTIDTFLEPRKRILSDGTLKEFEENELTEETVVIGNLAQRFSRYEKKGFLNGNYFEGNGHKLFQYIRTSNGWKINSVIWEDENS